MKKFYESYKLLTLAGAPYLDLLSGEIINSIQEMKHVSIKYDQINELADDNEKNIILNFFIYLQNLLWTNFCNLMRDYSNILYGLLNKKEILDGDKFKIVLVKKYSKIKEYIDSTKFISLFMGTESFNALSLALHNLNKLDYGEKNYNASFSRYEEFNIPLKENIDFIKKEFEKVIYLFRYYDGFNSCNIDIDTDSDCSIYKMFDFLLNMSKNNSK